MVGVAIGVLSVAVVVWARTRPGFDPYGWLVWGHQTLHLALDTNAAPSWKPLPYLFTVPFAVFGHYAVYLWLVTVVAFSLGGSVFAGRIAYRLVAGEPGGSDGAQVDRRGRIAGWVAAVVAGVGVLLIAGDSHVILSGQSDPMIVALCLGAIDMQLSRRYRWALAFWLLASLGRPEAWPFLGLYVIWAWRAVPSMRRMLIGGSRAAARAVVRDSGDHVPESVRRRARTPSGQAALRTATRRPRRSAGSRTSSRRRSTWWRCCRSRGRRGDASGWCC